MAGKKRSIAKRAFCPKCGAPPGQPCTGFRGDGRKAVHNARYRAAKAKRLQPPQPKPQPEKTGFYYSDEWRAVRYLALKLHGGACQCCGARGTRQSPLHVDHIKPRSKFPELELDLNNLQVLCEDCNLGKRNWDQTDWRVITGGRS